jgi:UMF1 family MFS transporter
MTLRPQAFGLRDAAQAVRLSFVTVGCWWALFTVPLILFVREPAPPPGRLPGGLVSGAFRELGRTFSHVRRLRTLFLFLLAYWCYIDGVDTIVRMAVDYGLSIGLVRDDLIVALLVTQFVGFPAALLFGRIGDRFGARRGIFAALGVYLLVTAWAALMQTRTEFFALAVAIGLVQGGIQALSRSYYARMLPAGRQAEFFGFYNMIGKFAAVIGPLLIGGSGLLARRLGAEPLAATRIGITSIALLFVVGGSLLRMVDEDRARLEALSLFGAGRSGNAADS